MDMDLTDFIQLFLQKLASLKPSPKQSEDCLYLNVYSSNLHGKEEQPVMVWIHGGNYVDGGSTDPSSTPSNVFLQKGVVVVTISYRLGIFGFFAHPGLVEESAEKICGNYGLLDQIKALEWVKQNIHKFGGDPDNVTIFGSSAGGDSVAHLMSSPKAEGLFQKAIIQSPGSSCPMLHLFDRFLSYPSAVEVGLEFAEKVGVREEQDQIEELRQIPAEQLLLAVHKNKFNDFFLPAVDGNVFPKSTFETFADGDQAKVPVIIGSTLDEGTIMYPYFQAPMLEYLKSPHLFENNSYLINNFPYDLNNLEQLYPGLMDNQMVALTNFFGDHNIRSGAYFYSCCAERSGVPTYLYTFNRLPPYHTQSVGAFHSSEKFFIFGKAPFALFPFGFNHEELCLSNCMIDYWTQFAKTGNPNIKGAPKWEHFSVKKPCWNILGTSEIGMQKVDKSFIEKCRILNGLRERRIAMAKETRAKR